MDTLLGFAVGKDKDLYGPGISKGRETDDCKTKPSMKFGYFEVVSYARKFPYPPSISLLIPFQLEFINKSL